jgi:putative glutathione S-transferase
VQQEQAERAAGALGLRRDLFQTTGFGDTIDFAQIKLHYYKVHTGINPTQIVPAGPDLSGWFEPHDRAMLGGSPFGAGSPPPSPPADEMLTASWSVSDHHRR